MGRGEWGKGRKRGVVSDLPVPCQILRYTVDGFRNSRRTLSNVTVFHRVMFAQGDMGPGHFVENELI